MISLSDADYLYFLGFSEQHLQLEKTLALLPRKKIIGETVISSLLARQLEAYFNQQSVQFDLPLKRFGTPFQLRVWQALQTIPYGQMRSYQWLANQVESPKGVRAVGLANGQNRFALIIPCHRVIRSNGAIGGYAGGVDKKQYLLQLERDIL